MTAAWPMRLRSPAFQNYSDRERVLLAQTPKTAGSKPGVRGAHLAAILEGVLNEANRQESRAGQRGNRVGTRPVCQQAPPSASPSLSRLSQSLSLILFSF